MDRFPFGASIKFGWQKTKESFWSLIAVTLIWLVISSVFNYSAKNFEKTMPLAYFVVQICSMVINMIMSLGITRIGLKVYAGEKFDTVELFNKSGQQNMQAA
jgi:predicted Na+-dependent transporter